MSRSKVAFKCKNCGRLHTCADAAEAAHPHACCVCGGGVVFRHVELAAKLLEAGADVRAISMEIARCSLADRRIDSSNWEVLAQVPHERLTELGLSRDDVEAHKAWPQGDDSRTPRHFTISAVEANAVSDLA